MIAIADTNGVVAGRRSAVLMARLVRGDGAVLRPADAIAIEYSIYELDVWPPHCFAPVAGHECAELSVADVLFDSLQLDEAWTVDRVGYNFRHAISFRRGRKGRFSSAGADYEVNYCIAPAIGAKTNVRFHLRGVCHDR